jgi:AcrR family transcriptional regulator
MECPPSDTRTALLHAALACFAESGFDGTSIRMIADRAQRPLSLLAHYFGNKEGLYLEVFKLIFENTLMRAQHSMPKGGQIPLDKADALRLLREQIQYIYLDASQCSMQGDPLHEYGSRLWLQEIRSPRPNLPPIFRAYMLPLINTIRNCIHTLRPDLDETEVVFFGVSVIGQIVGHSLMRGLNQVLWEYSEEAESDPRASRWVVDMCLHGLLNLPVLEPGLPADSAL